MLRSLRKVRRKNQTVPAVAININRTFLTNGYKCTESWNSQMSSQLLAKINLDDFYNKLDQNYTSKGDISAIDIDIFANAIKEPAHLEELKDLLYKLRLSAETGNMLDSTHHATIRNFIAFDHIPELVAILKDPLNYGVFLDDYGANMLLDTLLKQENYELAAEVASLVMLQEVYSNEITCSLCQYACYKYLTNYTWPDETAPAPEENNKKVKVEEIKIRIKFLRNPYFDDHFDLKDNVVKAGKTLAWISEIQTDNLNNNLQIVGWLFYKKYDKLLALCEKCSLNSTFKVYGEVLQILDKELNRVENENKKIIENSISFLQKVTENSSDVTMESSLRDAIENAINKCQNSDVIAQQKLFASWKEIREDKLEEQKQRLDRARRLQLIEEKQKEISEEEQKLWFFETEEKIDLQIEEKEKLQDNTTSRKSGSKTTDENYIPPEILPKRK